MRNVQSQIGQLPFSFPGQEVVAIQASPGAERSCASVYVSMQGGLGLTSGAGVGFQLTRLNLFAELGGIRQLMAAAFVQPGYSGLAIAAAGWIADSFHVSAQTTIGSNQQLTVGLATSACCAEPSVRVPVELLTPIPFQSLAPPAQFTSQAYNREFVTPAAVPLGLEHGAYWGISRGVIAGPDVVPFVNVDAPPPVRILAWDATPTAAAGLLRWFLNGQVIRSDAIAERIQAFPAGNFVADHVEITGVNAVHVDAVR